MGLRYQKKINLGGGTGVNLSRSGASFSYKNKYGSVGTRGFSIRTGIKGLSYRAVSGKNAGAIILAIMLISFFVLIIVNVFRFIGWLFSLPFTKSKHTNIASKLKDDLSLYSTDGCRHFGTFNKGSISPEYQDKKVVLDDLLVDDNTYVEKGQDIMKLRIGSSPAKLSSQVAGTVTFYKFPETTLVEGDYLFRIDQINPTNPK